MDTAVLALAKVAVVHVVGVPPPAGAGA